MITIIKNAPPPKAITHYPFADMEVGDAFDMPRIGKNNAGEDIMQKRICAASRVRSKSRGGLAKFTTRIHDDKTVRCYRIA
jgi:hypothetical protein